MIVAANPHKPMDFNWNASAFKVSKMVTEFTKENEKIMHYRNGREAKNGDKIVQLGGYGTGATIVCFGVLHDAVPGNDYCNGSIAPITTQTTVCMCDCLHVDDVVEMLKEKGLDKRPAGK